MAPSEDETFAQNTHDVSMRKSSLGVSEGKGGMKSS